MSHEYQIETPIGALRIAPTQADHIYAESPRDSPFVIRGVEIRASLHFHKRSDGSWQLGTSDRDAYQAIYASRRDNFGSASDAARKKLIEVLTPAVQAWVSAHPHAIDEAEIEHTETQLESAANAVKQATEKLQEAQTLYETLLAHHYALTGERYKVPQ